MLSCYSMFNQNKLEEIHKTQSCLLGKNRTTTPPLPPPPPPHPTQGQTAQRQKILVVTLRKITRLYASNFKKARNVVQSVLVVFSEMLQTYKDL